MSKRETTHCSYLHGSHLSSTIQLFLSKEASGIARQIRFGMASQPCMISDACSG